MQQALSWLGNNGGKKFFLFLHSHDAHIPFDAAEEFNIFYQYTGKFDKKEIGPNHPSAKPGTSEYDYVISQYDAGIRRADHHLGRLFAWLEARDLLESTLLIITSDHGETFRGLHGKWGHIYPLYEELLKVPLIIRVPGQGRTLVESQVPASISILPTVLSVLRIRKKEIGGRFSLVKAAKGKKGLFPVIISEAATARGKRSCRCLRTERWKLCSYKEGEEGRMREWDELYDLTRDPGEQNNAAELNPAVVQKLRKELSLIKASEIKARHQQKIDEKTREQLRSLGYIK